MASVQHLLRALRIGFFVTVAVTVLSVALRSAPVLGQSDAKRPVIVAVPDNFPSGTVPGPRHNLVAIILREPGQTDIIILNPEYATPAGLATGVGGLKRNRVEMPAPERGVLLVLRTAAPPRSNRAREAMVAALERVREQPRSRVGNIGTGRWFEFPARALGM